MKKILDARIFLLSVLLFATGCSGGYGSKRMAPNFTLKNMTGQDFTLSSYRGNVVLLVYFGVGCPPCRAEAPHLKSLQLRYGQKGFRIVAVNAWNEPTRKVRSFVMDNELPYTVILNGYEVFTEKYNGSGVPHSFLINPEGKVVYQHLGWDDSNRYELEEQIQLAIEDACETSRT